MEVSKRVNVATIKVDFSDDKSVYEAVMFILSNSSGGNASDTKVPGLHVLTTKVRITKTLMDYSKHLSSEGIGLNGKKKGSLGDAKRFLDERMLFILHGNGF